MPSSPPQYCCYRGVYTRIRQTLCWLSQRAYWARWSVWQVHVENMAAVHLIAAQRLHPGRSQSASELVAGEAFNISDFSQNIVSLCERTLPQSHAVAVRGRLSPLAQSALVRVDAEAAGARKPFVTLPYWLLWFLVRVAVLLSIVCHTIFCGLQILHPKTGAFHDKCLFESCVGALPLATIRVPRTNGRLSTH